MDLDHLARSLASARSRRSLVSVLAAPIAGCLLDLLRPEEEAKARRKQRPKRRKHSGKRKHRRGKPCRPESPALTCSGKCGIVTNSCKKTVDCGSCACDPPCPACFVCQGGVNLPGTCVLDPVLQGEICGEAGQVCQSDGSCTCDATCCPACTTCGGDGACAGCANCCDGSGVCQDGVTNQACGSSGTCDVCSGQEICQDQQCVCIPITQCPVELACGTISDGCGGQLTCGECANPTPLCTPHVCVPCE